MLPFLKARPQAGGISTIVRKSDNDGASSNENEGLEACARDLIDAIQSGDSKKAASALKSAFELCDSQPHDEGEHTNEQDQE